MPSAQGRGTGLNPPNRFERLHLAPDPDAAPEEIPDPRTQFFVDGTESLLVANESPDVGFSVGLNCYRGCEHGCAYCYARPFHEYLGWSSGIDFETRLLVKLRAPELLRRELGSRRWQPQVIGMSGITDCYQPCERHFRLTRACLEVLSEFRNPVSLITKNFLITRDVDLLAELARWSCAAAFITMTTLDAGLSGKLEPRAARPEHRLRAIRVLAEAGVPVGVMIAPVIPGLTDHEIPGILAAAHGAGARRAGFVMLRLPGATREIFGHWLDEHEPGKKARVFDRLRALHGGRLYRADFAARMRGQGIFAEQVGHLFAVARRKLGYTEEPVPFSTAHFRPPGGIQTQLAL